MLQAQNVFDDKRKEFEMNRPQWFTEMHWNAIDLAKMHGLPASMANTYLREYNLGERAESEAISFYISEFNNRKGVKQRTVKEWLFDWLAGDP